MTQPIEATYFDKVTISRMVNVQQPNGAFKQERVVVASDVKCGLSMSRMTTASKTDSSPVTDGNPNSIYAQYQLYCNIDVDIRHGDKLVVSHLGKTIIATASAPFHYDSHQVMFLGEYTFG